MGLIAMGLVPEVVDVGCGSGRDVGREVWRWVGWGIAAIPGVGIPGAGMRGAGMLGARMVGAVGMGVAADVDRAGALWGGEDSAAGRGGLRKGWAEKQEIL